MTLDGSTMMRSLAEAHLSYDEGHAAVERVCERLSAIDWDFPNRGGGDDLEGIHPYPAKFVGELPCAIIKAIAPPRGTLVLDPFVGSGSTLVECQRAGLASVGVDLNPIACLLSRVKTRPLPENLEAAALAAFDRALDADAAIPPIPNLDHWFQPQVRRALANLTLAIAEAPERVQAHLRLALSSIIVRVSNQDSDTRYAAVAKTVSERAVYEAFVASVGRLARALRGRRYVLSPAAVVEADTLSVEPEQLGGRAGLVITSPPYPNAYEYWLYHKYRMWWLGHDAKRVKDREIGARVHFFKKNHHTAADFNRQMSRTFRLLNKATTDEAYAAFVVGRSKIHGKVVDNGAILVDAAALANFECVFSTERTIQATRKSFNLSHANIKTEQILVFRKRAQ